VIGPSAINLELESIADTLDVLHALTFPLPLSSIPERHHNLVSRLAGAGAVHLTGGREHPETATITDTRRRAGSRPVCSRLVVAATGAVQSFALPKLLYSSFMPFARVVDVILTSSAQRFVTHHSIEAMGARVWTDPFDTDVAPVPHMELAKSDLMVVYPASAATLHRLACGAASDLLSLVAAATAGPVLVVPAMNGQMWSHPPIQRNVRQLVDAGFYVAVPSLMQEVSAGVGAPPIFGGAGLGAHNLQDAMIAVIDEHARQRSNRADKPARSGTR
jgi:hypothetical protein